MNLEPEKYTDEDGNEYYCCPTCQSTILVDWDFTNHCAVYPDICSECDTPIIWGENQRLTNLRRVEPDVVPNKKKKPSYINSKRFTAFKKER